MAKIKNPIQYTSRTFNTVLADINSDTELTDKPDWWKRALAGVMDVLSMMINAEANNAVLRTSFTRQAVSDLLALIDYQITERQTASGAVLFYINSSASFPFTVASADLVGLTEGSLVVSAKRFEGRSSVNVSAIQESILNTAVDVGTDIFTVSRDYTTGEKVIVSGSDLPTPIVSGTEYWVIRASATQIRLATSLSNAYAGTFIDILVLGTGNIVIDLYSFSTTLFQQETKTQQNLGSSDGISEFQEFDLPDLFINQDTLTITINGDSYERVDTFVFSGPTDNVYKLIYKTDESSFVQFGNDEFGVIPPAFDILANYAVGGGADSNVKGIDKLNIYAGSDSNITAISNPGELTGGANQQGIEQAKVLGPLLLKARDRFVTTEDGEALALSFGGFSQVKVNKNAFGTLSAQVLAIANGGGNPDSATKTDLQEFLIERTVLESIDVRAEDNVITSTNVTSAGKILSGFTFADVQPFFDLAWRLFLSEAGQEVFDTFLSSGITDTIDLINTLFSTSFTIDDSVQIQNLVENLEPRKIGVDIQESDAFGYIDSNVIGLDYLTITAPSFPITLADDEITTDGTISSSEIP